MITATVMVTIPPSSSDNPIPIAVVMDFGSSVTYCLCDNLKISDNTNTHSAEVMAPAKIPARIAFQFFLRGSICSYKGTASATVAGVRKYERYFAPLSYVS